MRWLTASIIFLLLAGGTIVRADVRMPALFGDHMVLQRNMAVPVWGWADAGEKVTVTIGATSATATTGADGKWSLKLDVLKVDDQPTTLVITGKNTLQIKDVLVGDVWVCAGQSNMGYTLNGVTNAAEAMKNAKDDDLRLFIVTPKLSFEKQSDCDGRWTRCTPASAGNFTAVGYYLGRDLRKELKLPIGLIMTSLGGTSGQAWMTREGMEACPALHPMLAAFDRDRAKLQALTDKYDMQTVPQWKKEDAAWRRDVMPAYQQAVKDWTSAASAARAAGQPVPPKPQPGSPKPSLAAPPNRMTPLVLNNAMLAPLLPFAIKGVAWYQGEHNTFDPKLYAELFPALIADWRRQWGQGDFPFIYVQISDFGSAATFINVGKWAMLRESQLLSLRTPNTGMVVSVDVGDPTDVHYKNKQPVGERLALVARHLAYGHDVVFSGPLYDRMEKAPGVIVVRFKYAERGLMIGMPSPEHAAAQPAPAGTALVGFEIAGPDKKFVPADAKIEGSTLVVSHPGITDPVAVRYGWADNPKVNLYNQDGLPASPFRTDNWEK